MSNVTVKPLYEGTFSVGLDKQFNRIGKADPPKKGGLKLSIQPFLISEGKRNILFDTGIGDLFGGDTSIDTILTNLDEHGVSNLDVTDIFLSHLHFDHMAGLANRANGYWELTFPEADVWVNQKAWTKLEENIDEHGEDKAEFFYFLDSHANIRFTDEQSNPIEHVRVETIGGHTEFHQALFYENGENRYVMSGDVIGTRGAINRSYAAKYDFDPKTSMSERDRLQKLAFEEGYVMMAYHETDTPLFRLTSYDKKKGFQIQSED
ncbi:MAG: MBL fold metallo-hydrolase [Balneolaceae bacterium]|nr:MBL fold metallo-hydrolase [Balneolaceae bacterium]MCH8548654.1 MBL fold metallo-hydrolase [Balneolaceae bacterium]